MRQVKFGLAGAGSGAKLLMRGIKELEGEGVVKVSAVCSKHVEKAREFAKRWGINEWYASYGEMIRKADIEAVMISTPHYLHFPMSIEAFERGLHVLVDKPMAINLIEADEMIRRARRNNVKLGVVLELRFSEGVKLAKEYIDSGKLGELILGEAVVEWFREKNYYSESSWRGSRATEGGGAVINQAIHSIDLLRWFMGPVDELWAITSTLHHEVDVEDTAVAIMKFHSKGLGVIQASTAIYPGYPNRVEVHGSEGTVIIEGDRVKSLEVRGGESFKEDREIRLETWRKPNEVSGILYKELIKDFIEAIIEDRDPLISGEEGRKSLEVVRAIYISGKTQKPVKFPIRE